MCARPLSATPSRARRNRTAGIAVSVRDAMKVLLVHERYQYAGGEDTAFEADRALLTAAGHSVTTYIRSNDEISSAGVGDNLRLAASTIWSGASYRDMERLVREQTPDVVHCHNTLPL